MNIGYNILYSCQFGGQNKMPWGKRPKKGKKKKTTLPSGFWGNLGVARLGSRKQRVVESIVARRVARIVYPILKQLFAQKALTSSSETRASSWKSKRRLAKAIARNKREKKETKSKRGAGDQFVKDPILKQSFGVTQLYDQGERGKVDFPDFVKDAIIKQSFFSAPTVGSGANPGGRVYKQQGSRSSSKPSGNLDWHVGTWNFKVSIDGIPISSSSFQSVSGINTETEMIEFKFGPDPFVRTLPGKTKFGNVELARIYKMGSLELYNWRNMAESGMDNIARNVRIDIYGTDLKQDPVMSLVLHDCFPVKWECPDLNAGSSEGAIEKLTLSISRVTNALGGTTRPTKYD